MILLTNSDGLFLFPGSRSLFKPRILSRFPCCSPHPWGPLLLVIPCKAHSFGQWTASQAVGAYKIEYCEENCQAEMQNPIPQIAARFERIFRADGAGIHRFRQRRRPQIIHHPYASRATPFPPGSKPALEKKKKSPKERRENLAIDSHFVFVYFSRCVSQQNKGGVPWPIQQKLF